MKILIQNGDYIFTPGGSGVGTLELPQLSAANPLELESLLLVTHLPSGTIIYNFADPIKTATCDGSKFNLNFDTSAYNGSDELQIWYWDHYGGGQYEDQLGVAQISPPLKGQALSYRSDNQGRMIVVSDTDGLPVVGGGNNPLATEGTLSGVSSGVSNSANSLSVIDDAFVNEDAALVANPKVALQGARKREVVVNEGVAEGDAIALNASEKGELLAAITDMSMILKRQLVAISDLAQAVRLVPYPVLQASIIDFPATITSLTAVGTLTTLSTITSLGLKDTNYVVDKFISLEAETMFNRVLSY